MSAAAESADDGTQSRQALQRLFLTLFLRGRGARGLNRSKAPGSIARKLALSLVVYAGFGLLALTLLGQPTFVLAIYLHAMTFVFLALYVATSAGEVLFNKEEADILLHRPIAARDLLWAKVAVLVQVSLWLAAAFNLTGLVVGTRSSGAWLFPVAHVLSTVLLALFCVGFVVLAYQLCLRWFGRERLDRFMTWVQILVSVGFVAAAQIVPRVLAQAGGFLGVRTDAWWLFLLPPAWFAGLDDALAGGGMATAWLLAAIAVTATVVVCWLAFGRLARDYFGGLQRLSEAPPQPKADRPRGRSWTERLTRRPPLDWWLRSPAERGAFMLSAAYIFRDREVKLRLFPGIAPALIIPIIFVFQGRDSAAAFPLAFSGMFIGMIPLTALRLLRYSQQWQAADLFRVAPIGGPAGICHGARRAVLCCLALPAVVLVALVSLLLVGASPQLELLLPGVIALPLYALIPCLGGDVVPLSHPVEDARAASRGIAMFAVLIASAVVAGVVAAMWMIGIFWQFLVVELILVTTIYFALRRRMAKLVWAPIE